ncbi:MAG: ABC transporter permease [Betaproteobacteria bacterium]|nr:ABC transporter permease [Betaproteobacteria bacterium]MDE2004009.1 ABC transporter permease [Betaproteobacteria bacterium]MDE2209873.1 ABC transporter permease [Betaproteobacteria bacterium]
MAGLGAGSSARSKGAPSGRELFALSTLGLLAFFAVWYGVASSGWVPSRFLPGPVVVADTIARLSDHAYAGYTIEAHTVASLQRFGLGFGLAVALGVPLGLLMGWYRGVDDVVAPLFESVRFIAPIAWVPFAALWFGTGIGGPILIIFSGAFPPCVINAYRGARQVDTVFVEAAQTLGAGGLRIITEVLVPAALPSIVAGLRVSAGLGWQSLIGAELIVVSSGVGYLMVQGQTSLQTPIVMSAMVAIGVVGFVIDVALRALESVVQRSWGVEP